MARQRWFAVTFVLGALAACPFDGGTGQQPLDAPPIDGPVSDGQLVDGERSDGAKTDAGPEAGMVDACLQNRLSCEMKGGTCNTNGACEIMTSGSGKVTCPDGMPCKVVCVGGNDACKDGVDCAGATNCDVHCTAQNACQSGGVDCGTAASCTVRCVGQNACQDRVMGEDHSIECGSAGSCTVTCDNGSPSACQYGVDGNPAGSCSVSCCDSTGCDMNDSPNCTVDSTCS